MKRVGRPRKPVKIGVEYGKRVFEPGEGEGVIYITEGELEAMRLVDLLGLKQYEAAEKMGISRTTLWRLLRNARRKVADALVNGKRIVVGEGV